VTEHKDKQVNAYNRMLESIKSFVVEAEKEFGPKIQFGIAAAKDNVAKLGELTQHEVDIIGGYLHRDLHDAGDYLRENGKELADWLKFDIALIEDRLIDTFSVLADQTKVELAQLADRANQIGIWKTGEITGIGTLVCKSCGEQLQFQKPEHIPPCPKCNASEFKRSAG